MPSRAIQVAAVNHENHRFPSEAPGFVAGVDSAQALWDAVRAQPGVDRNAKFIIEMPNPAGGTWWQRQDTVDKLPEEDVIRVKAVRPAAYATTPVGGKAKQKGARAAPQREPKSPAKKEPRTPPAKEYPEAPSEEEDRVKQHLDSLMRAIISTDAKMDDIEAKMLDSYDNDKKMAALARIQDRLADTQRVLHKERFQLLSSYMNYEAEEREEELWGMEMAEMELHERGGDDGHEAEELTG